MIDVFGRDNLIKPNRREITVFGNRRLTKNVINKGKREHLCRVFFEKGSIEFAKLKNRQIVFH